MSGFTQRVAALTGTPEQQIERLSGGDLSQVLLLRRPDGRCTVAKGGPAAGTEAAMLRALAGAGVAAPSVEGEFDGILLLEHVPNDSVFSARAWSDIGSTLRRLHDHQAERFGWPVDFRIGTVDLNNREGSDWPRFWGEQRLVPTASVLDRPWRERVERLAPRVGDLLPASPRASFLHGDLWTGNILVAEGRVAALIDPACYYGHAEVDLAMLSLFAVPPPEFEQSYGGMEPGWEERRAVYQLFPALLHLRLFGQSYASLADRLLTRLGV